MERDDVSSLKSLGSNKTEYNFDSLDPKLLEVFLNPAKDRDYHVSHETSEFTSRCPKTGQPDFAHITIDMIPDDWCVESKSLKLYLMSYRNAGAFMERIVNTILDDLVEACQPRWCLVTGKFGSRGGIQTTILAEYNQPDALPLPTEGSAE